MYAVLRLGEAPSFHEGVPSLDVIQAAVGGWIECVPGTGNGLTLYCNEEGKLQNREPNFRVLDPQGGTLDVIVGDVVAVRTDETGETVSLETRDLNALLLLWIERTLDPQAPWWDGTG